MYRQNNRAPRFPPRSSRHRSSVLGPPPGTEAGTGYISPPQTSPITYEFPEPPTSLPLSRVRNSATTVLATASSGAPDLPSTPPSLNSRTTLRTIPGKPDPSSSNARPSVSMRDDPMTEDAPAPPPRSSKRGRKPVPRSSTGDENTLPGVMFYPSTTTISSIDEAELRKLDQMEPMPFFKVDPRMPMPASQQSDDVKSSMSNPSRAVSTASSGVLGPVTIDVDPDTDFEDNESEASSTSEFEQLVRSVSLVRRGTATIVRNPSSRRSVVPEVRTPKFRCSLMWQISKPATSLQKRVSNPPDIPLPQPPTVQRRISRQGGLAPLILSQFPSVPAPARAPSSVYSTATATPTARKSPNPALLSPGFLPGPKLSPTLFPVSRQPSSGIRLPPTSPLPATPTSSGSSNVSSGSSLSSSNDRGKRRPPPINMNAIAEGQARGSMTSLTGLLDRATKLHEVLATGRTASSINLHGFPDDLRDSTSTEHIMSLQGNSSALNTIKLLGGPRGYFVNHFPASTANVPRTNGASPIRWPIFNFPQSARSQNVTTRPTDPYGIFDGRIVPQDEGIGSKLFPKYDPNDSTPTGPLFTSPGGGNGRENDDGKGPSVHRERRCCGLKVRTFVIVLIIIVILVIVAVLTPVFILRNRRASSSSQSLSLSQCEIQFRCQNGGASYLTGNPLQCTCLCAAGFSGGQCQTHDSACVPFTAKDDSANGTSIGSAIQPLLQVAQSNFSSQFNLSADRIIAQFSANNVSCASQNTLVILNGTTSADLGVSEVDRLDRNAVFEASTTVTLTTIIENTSYTTLPTILVTLSEIYTKSTTVQTTSPTTNVMTSSTIVATTMTVPSGQNGPTLTQEDLVFGRCAILAVVQGFGVSEAAEVQETMQLVINRGGTFVNDTAVGVGIDLLGRTITGLPKGG